MINHIQMTPREYLKTLPSTNNSRKILREWIEKAEKAHGDEGNYYVRKLEEMGFVGDLRDGKDLGNLMPENEYD